jgi:hypothetical protein
MSKCPKRPRHRVAERPEKEKNQSKIKKIKKIKITGKENIT